MKRKEEVELPMIVVAMRAPRMEGQIGVGNGIVDWSVGPDREERFTYVRIHVHLRAWKARIRNATERKI